jgi:uroporphyrinogen III methyltransferase/synthase
VVTDPADAGVALADAARRLQSYDWVVLTSANGARRLLDALHDARDLGGVRVAAIGPGTADVLRGGNIVADLVPERFVAESLLEAFPAPPAEGGRVLLARAAVARDVLPDGLRDAGWEVDVVDAYRTEAAPIDDGTRAAVAGADVITFTSSSTVDRYVEAFGLDAVPAIVASIGPITSATARGHGIEVDVEATDHSIPGLVEALVKSMGAAPTAT